MPDRPFVPLCRALCALGVMQALSFGALAQAGPAGPTPTASAPAPAPEADSDRPLDLTLHFLVIDANVDGRVGLDEMTQASARHPASRKLFQWIDFHADGVPDPLEIDRLRVLPQIDIGF